MKLTKDTLETSISEQDLYAQIFLKMQEIKETYPELYVFLDEMWVNAEAVPTLKGTINDASLKAYKDSLDALVSKYTRANRNM